MHRVAIALCVVLTLAACDSGGDGGGGGPVSDLTGPSLPAQSDGRGGTLYEGTVPPSYGFAGDFYCTGKRWSWGSHFSYDLPMGC